MGVSLAWFVTFSRVANHINLTFCVCYIELTTLTVLMFHLLTPTWKNSE